MTRGKQEKKSMAFLHNKSVIFSSKFCMQLRQENRGYTKMIKAVAQNITVQLTYSLTQNEKWIISNRVSVEHKDTKSSQHIWRLTYNIEVASLMHY